MNELYFKDVEFICPDGCTWNTYGCYFFGSVLKLCCCRSHELDTKCLEVLKKLYDSNHRLTNQNMYFVSDDLLAELFLHIFNEVDICEHGGSVRGSWLAPKGVEFCKQLFS